MIAGIRRTRLVAGSLFLVPGLLVPGCSPAPPDGGGNTPSPTVSSLFDDVVDVEVMKGLPGFSTRSESEYSYAGFDITLMNDLARDLNFEVNPQDVPPGAREENLVKGIADLAVATYTITDARDEKIDFTAPYFKTYQGLLIRQSDTTIKTLDDVRGKRVCSALGTTSDPDSALRKEDQRRLQNALGAEATIELRNDYKSCVRELRNKNFDAVWTDRILLEGFAQTPPYSKDVKVAPNITIQNRQFYGIGIKEGYEADCQRINRALKRFLSTRWRETFRDHYPDVAKRDPSFEQTYKPTSYEFDRYEETSCGGAS